MLLGSVSEARHALEAGVVSLHAKVKGRFTVTDEEGNQTTEVHDTTPGRMILAELLPKSVKPTLVNQLLTKKAISGMIDAVYRNCGQKETVIFCDRIMALGFKHAFQAGISFGKDDMLIPDTKTKIVAQTTEMTREFEQQYNDGLITQLEKYNKVVDAWSKCTDQIAKEMMERISSVQKDKNGREKQMNSVWMMSHSGARGSPAQMKQLAGMRGLMTKPSGEIIETPIISNFKEGLSVLEYFNSTHGARKGLADTALKTANSGYLTRRLVDVAQDSIIYEDDCGTERGIKVQAVVDAGQVIVSLANRVLGRTAAEDIVDPANRKAVLVKTGELIEERHAEAIEKAQVQEVRIRSVLTCDTVTGVCAKCYGRDLARGTPVNIGEAVGVIAAQSIGEPGTQLTMRTFHIGGAANLVDSSFIESNFNGTVKVKNPAVVKDSQGREVAMTRTMAVVIVDQSGKELATHKVPYGSRVHVKEGDTVKRGTKIAQWDPFTRPVLTEVNGKVDFEDLIEGASVREQTDEMKGTTNRVIVDWRASPRSADLKPAVVVKDGKGKPIKVARGGDARYLLSVDAILSVEPGQDVKAGDVLARVPTASARSGDITGGLPRVAELFEARRPKDHAIIAEISGTVEFGKDYKNKQRITIKPDDAGAEPVEYLIPRGKSLAVQHGDRVERGDFVYDGHPAPHDILAIKGVEELANYLINEIQDVYRLQGVTINDKHIEVIVRQMLQKVEVTDVGETDLIKGEQLDRVELDELNAKFVEAGKKPAAASPVLLGITKASLQTRSFISAASFQETTRVLTDAAVNGKVDTLEGLKENVIVGRLIPAGTGGALRRLRKIAAKRDELIAREQAKVDAEKALAGPGAGPVRRRRRTAEEAVE
jgi:DNA-directed RNA polymerase subunit beta'